MMSGLLHNDFVDAIQLSIFASRVSALCDEMGAVLRRAAFSPNIKDRLDFSCALFDSDGRLCAQAAHIPVHLGSMAYAMADLVKVHDWRAGDMLVVNDPFSGGTHLPDITLVAPVFVGDVAWDLSPTVPITRISVRTAPAQCLICSRLEDEGLLIPPTLLVRDNALLRPVLDAIVEATHNRTITEGDFSAQISANRAGVQRVIALVEEIGIEPYLQGLEQHQCLWRAYGPEGDRGATRWRILFR